jgi:hypothetical protein
LFFPPLAAAILPVKLTVSSLPLLALPFRSAFHLPLPHSTSLPLLLLTSRLLFLSPPFDPSVAGKNLPATLAESHGLISRIVPDSPDSPPGSGVLAEALKVAETIASKGRLATLAAKECVKHSEEVGMSSGLAFERRLFQGLFATADQKEGESRSLLDMGERTVTSWVSRAFGRERSLTFLW